ncbi:MAG: hypothetical protein JST22_04895 [Bacteroidetes bacterium]|nr:hypothetical protein [Bacteroidota bacterium]
MSAQEKKFEAIAESIVAGQGARRGRMFGMPTISIGGKAFAGYLNDAMVFKLTGESHAEAMALAGAHLFDPSGMGRPMKEWVVIPSGKASQWERFAARACEIMQERLGTN